MPGWAEAVPTRRKAARIPATKGRQTKRGRRDLDALLTDALDSGRRAGWDAFERQRPYGGRLDP
jgi:hypothetical protein